MSRLEKLRICFLAGTLTRGGAERQLYYILKSLVKSGADVRLLCLTRGDFWEERIAALGVPITWVGKSPLKMARLLEIVTTLRRQPPDILQSQHFYTNLYAAVAARALGIRGVGAIRNDAYFELRANGPVYGQLSLRLPRVIVANSRRGIQNAIRLGVPKSRLHLLPNVVDCAGFTPGEENPGMTVTVVTAGRLVEQKRLDRFLEILSTINRVSPHTVRGVILGGGPLLRPLQKRAVELGLGSDDVEFTGPVADVAAHYRRADIFLLTSDWEGTPNVLLEAMASGLPAVASDVGGVGDVITDNETGVLANPQDIESYIRPMIALARDRQLRRRLARQARRYVASHHALDLLPRYLSDIYSKLV